MHEQDLQTVAQRTNETLEQLLAIEERFRWVFLAIGLTIGVLVTFAALGTLGMLR